MFRFLSVQERLGMTTVGGQAGILREGLTGFDVVQLSVANSISISLLYVMSFWPCDGLSGAVAQVEQFKASVGGMGRDDLVYV